MTRLPGDREDFEATLAAQLTAVGIPFERQFRFLPGRDFRADFRLGSLLVEVDGGVYVSGGHNRGAAYERDRERDALAMMAGYRVLRVTPRHVTDGLALRWIEELTK